MIKGVLFDLDGTLADTAPDLAYALNETLKFHHKSPLPFEIIRPVATGLFTLNELFNLGCNDLFVADGVGGTALTNLPCS